MIMWINLGAVRKAAEKSITTYNSLNTWIGHKMHKF
jgi:hypothetical protein